MQNRVLSQYFMVKNKSRGYLMVKKIMKEMIFEMLRSQYTAIKACVENI